MTIYEQQDALLAEISRLNRLPDLSQDQRRGIQKEIILRAYTLMMCDIGEAHAKALMHRFLETNTMVLPR